MLSVTSSEGDESGVHTQLGFSSSSEKLSPQKYHKKQLIEMIVRRLSSMQPPECTDIINTGHDPCPIQMGSGMHQTPVCHEEADVLVAYHAFNEAVSGRSVKAPPWKRAADRCPKIISLRDSAILAYARGEHGDLRRGPSATPGLTKSRIHPRAGIGTLK